MPASRSSATLLNREQSSPVPAPPIAAAARRRDTRLRAGNLAHLQAGAYQPVSTEAFVPDPVVIGSIPAALDGSFLRVGPNPVGGRQAESHLCAGDPMVHALRLRDGRAEWYRNRWVRTDRVTRHLGEMPTPGPRRGLSEDANGNVIRHAGRTLVLGDAGVLPFEIGADLETKARIDFDGTLPGGLSAHPELDPVTGELNAIAYSPQNPYLDYLAIGTDGQVRRSERIRMSSASMMHAFSITERYAVVYDLPVTYDPARAAEGNRVPYGWNDNYGARICILPRDGSGESVRRMEIEPCYVFHPVNAYEPDRDHVVIDVVRHQRAFDADPLRPSESQPALWRWTVDLRRGTVVERQLADYVEEFPRIDDRFKGSFARYGFAVEMDNAGLAGRSLLRHDLVTGRTDVHRFGHGRETGEAVFVPRGPDAPEADGWLLSMVYDRATDRSQVVVLDTADFTGDPVAVVQLPVRVPHGFHSTWIPA